MSRKAALVSVGGCIVFLALGTGWSLSGQDWVVDPHGESRLVDLAQPTPPGAPDDGEGETFGVSVGEYHWLSCPSFGPRFSNQTLSSETTNDYCWRTGGSEQYYIADLDLPTGAYLNALRLFYYDASVSGSPALYLCRKWMDSPEGTNPGTDCPWSVLPSGSPGYASAFLTPLTTVQRRFDVDNDGTIETVRWLVFVGLPLDSNVRLGAVRTHWLRTVSPAPATATFSDVPTGHLFFQYVEALAASGITAGCGGGAFCPDQPVTRGQMAVFLAKALGLHWYDF